MNDRRLRGLDVAVTRPLQQRHNSGMFHCISERAKPAGHDQAVCSSLGIHWVSQPAGLGKDGRVLQVGRDAGLLES